VLALEPNPVVRTLLGMGLVREESYKCSNAQGKMQNRTFVFYTKPFLLCLAFKIRDNVLLEQ
jgi:hypothetical protein